MEGVGRPAAGRASGEAGQSLVEIALALPIVVLILVGAADLGEAFAVQLAVQNGARAGAEAVALGTATLAAAQGAATAEMSGTPGLDAAAAAITLTLHGGDLVDGSCLAIPPTLATPCYATVRVRYTYSTIMRWPGIPPSFTFDRSATFARYR